MELDSCAPAMVIESDSGALTHVARKRKQKQRKKNIQKSEELMMSQHDIPEELIVQILPFLPVKSLLRFRALSKDIGARLDNTDFINSHLCKSFKLIFLDGSENKLHVCDVNNLDMEKKILHLGISSYSSQKYKFYSYCKGLILFKRSDELFGLTLWNPSTNKYKDLPHCPVIDGFELSSTTLLCLVYDDFIDDYKAFISISYSQRVQIHYHNYEYQVWVYELKSNIWRKVQNDNRFRSMSNRIDCFTNGSLHWLSEYNKKTRKIEAFDVRKETFYLVPLPDCEINLMDRVSSKLHDFDGCLCISYFCNIMQFKAALYMRKKDEDQFTWIQLYSVRPPVLPTDLINMWSETIKVIGYPKRGSGDDDKEKKILLHLDNRDYIVSYDIEKKSFGKVKIVNKDPTWVSPFFCIESFQHFDINS